MIRKLIACLFFYVTFLNSPVMSQQTAPIDYKLPDPAITSIQLDALGHVVRVDFAQGAPLTYPTEVESSDLKGISIIDIYTLPLELVLYRDLREYSEDELFDRIHLLCHRRHSWYCNAALGGAIDFDPDTGKMITPLGADGLEQEEEDLYNNAEMENVEIIDIIELKLIEYKNDPDGPAEKGILRLSLSR